ncbi:hypothetical protein [Micromonospora sp. WMMD1082]|uniref:hypothetical protein n=1 Tax=Micromonospora sp. WMMD1082 TaxID=3016104 RepID=UPI002417230C|nr:hypothetical protein [Micromonospora sp. WMMD1082]MDG4795032.1 hypothetical protein [Micromonospora sp. WMMD1082]
MAARAHLAAVIRAVIRRDPALEPYLSPTRPECGQIPQPQDDDHTARGATVVIGCEGY